jgi:hypothetical protein
MAHLGISFEPPSTDQYEEQARYDCIQLVRDGRLDGASLLSQRDGGIEWSTIRDEATPGRSSDPDPTAAGYARLNRQVLPHGRTHRHMGGMTDPKALRELSTALQSHAQELRWSAQEARNRSIALRHYAEKVRRTGFAARSRSDQATLRLGYLQILMPGLVTGRRFASRSGAGEINEPKDVVERKLTPQALLQLGAKL